MSKYFPFNRLAKPKNILVFLFFLVFLILGLFIYKDYGISVDENFHRLMGFYWLNYIAEFFPDSSISKNIDLILKNIKVSSFENINELEANDFVYGIIFDVPLAFIEVLFNIQDPLNYFHTRHLFNFLTFFLSSIFFYKILVFRFIDWKWALLGTLFLILSPRIFANSFYNNKDIVFLSLFLISIFFAFKLLKDFNLLNCFNFSFFSALATSSRIVGFLIILVFIIFFLLSLLSKPEKNFKNLRYIIFLLLFYSLFTVILWPYLWLDPVNNFISAFKIHASYPRSMFLLFDSDYIKTSFLPWYYAIKWILISTPPLYIIFFFIGFFSIFFKFIKRFININENQEGYDLWKSFHEKIDLFIFFIIFFTIFSTIKFNTTLYTGWRQLYFLYPLIIYISVIGLQNIYKLINKKNIIISSSIVLIYLSYISVQIYLMHPFQNVYFNFLAGQNVHKKYEVDFWGLANKRFLEKILFIEKDKNIVNIGVSSFTTLDRSIVLLDKKVRNKINIVGQEHKSADYIFTNFMSEVDKNIDNKYEIPTNFKLFDEFFINGIKVYEVYKKNY